MMSSLNCRTEQLNLRRILKSLKKRKLFLNDNWLVRLMILKLKRSVIQFVRPRGTIFAYGPFKNYFQTMIGYLNLPTCLWVICGGETMSDSIFKHSPKVDVQKSLSKPVTTQSLPKNEKDQLLKRIAYLESKLASQDIRSCQKEYHELRTSYNALKVKFDSLNRQKWNINVSKSSKPKESVSEKVHTGESSKPFSRRVSQFTTYSLQKDRKFSKKSQSFETFSPHKGFKTRASNENNQSFETSHSCFTPVKQVWSPIKESQTFEASSSQKSFKTSTFKGKNHVFVTPHSRFTPVKQVWRPKQSHSKSFKYSKSEMLSMQNKNDFASTINKKGRVSNETNFQDVSSNDINKWKSSSSTRFKTPFETPSFKNQWNIKRNFKSPLIPRELFSNETPVSSPRWNSTSLHRLDTTFNWFSKFGKPVSTVLKWVPKVVV
ncbi:hypothetical protein Tco_0605239 [Tanacetum coccineum]